MINHYHRLRTKYQLFDWSRRVQYWPHCTLDVNIVHFKKKATTFEFLGAKK